MNAPGPGWQRVGPAAELDEEDVMPFEFDGREYAIYHTIDGFFGRPPSTKGHDTALRDTRVQSRAHAASAP